MKDFTPRKRGKWDRIMQPVAAPLLESNEDIEDSVRPSSQNLNREASLQQLAKDRGLGKSPSRSQIPASLGQPSIAPKAGLKQKSNVQLVKLAFEKILMPQVTQDRVQIFKLLDEQKDKNHIVLFKSNQRYDYRALYRLVPCQDICNDFEAVLVHQKL